MNLVSISSFITLVGFLDCVTIKMKTTKETTTETTTIKIKRVTVEGSRWSSTGCDFWGNDIQIFSSSSVTSCSNSCLQNNDCTHYTFNGDINQCYLKNGYVTKNDATPWYSDNVVCGIPR